MTDWLAYFRVKTLRCRNIEMAAPDTTDYKWSISGCIHPGYNDRDLVLYIKDLDEPDTIPLDPEAAKDLHEVLTAYLQWLKESETAKKRSIAFISEDQMDELKKDPRQRQKEWEGVLK